MQDAKREFVDPAMAARQVRPRALGQPIAREARHDTAGHHRDQNDNGGQPQPPSQPRWHGNVVGLEVHQQIGDPENAHRRHHWQVAPVPPDNDLPRDDTDQHHRKGKVRRDGDPRWNKRREQAGNATQQPQSGQQRQRTAADRKPARPVRDGGQQEAGNRCHHEAEQHFMDMPGKRIEPARYSGSCREHDDPDRERHRRPETCCQKEGPEALGEKCRHRMGAFQVRRHGQ